MNTHLVLIINLTFDKILNLQNIDTSQSKIFSFCCVLIEWLMKKNFFKQIAIIVSYKDFLKQVSHFTNNNFHHFQGLKSIERSRSVKCGIKFSILLANRLIGCVSHFKNFEILLISFGNVFFSFPFDFIGANVVKKDITFSSINFTERIFIYEVISKLSGGIYINCNLKKKNEIFHNLEKKYFFRKRTPIHSHNYLVLGIERIKICSFALLKNKKIKSRKQIKYCSFCKELRLDNFSERCLICKMIYTKNFHLTQKIDLTSFRTIRNNFFLLDSMIKSNYLFLKNFYYPKKNNLVDFFFEIFSRKTFLDYIRTS
ncbi:hypothetical protein CPARA_2gp198 (nucleomorph) [Cryptomonas paramecium]|uniref:Uncharacterized protein n=1 Tax=Cryptomonas paramaecium TaxID=2898 RepID=F2HHR0_9CRYP|nr:hypothetical protein CPARA_2gp198 [Cryptomonas paramecium]AEA38856.1 hypothetical protein CPARA_2gp198 [Cryptomonas paramecium]